jgi:hypothetical protein
MISERTYRLENRNRSKRIAAKSWSLEPECGFAIGQQQNISVAGLISNNSGGS